MSLVIIHLSSFLLSWWISMGVEWYFDLAHCLAALHIPVLDLLSLSFVCSGSVLFPSPWQKSWSVVFYDIFVLVFGITIGHIFCCLQLLVTVFSTFPKNHLVLKPFCCSTFASCTAKLLCLHTCTLCFSDDSMS